MYKKCKVKKTKNKKNQIHLLNNYNGDNGVNLFQSMHECQWRVILQSILSNNMWTLWADFQ